jgi:hypothetical protein
VPIQALLSNEIDFPVQGRFEIFNQPHVTDYARRTAEAHQDIDITVRPVFTASYAAEYSGIAHTVLPEYGICPQFDVFDGHISFIPLRQEKSMNPTT